MNFVSHLKICKRSDSQPLKRGDYENIDIYPKAEPIIDFSMKKGRIFAVTEQGTALIHDGNKTYRYRMEYKYDPTACADFCGNVFVIGGSNNCRIFHHIENDVDDRLQLMKTFNVFYNGLEMIPNSNNRFVGFRSANNSESVIHDVDIET